MTDKLMENHSKRVDDKTWERVVGELAKRKIDSTKWT